MQRSPWMSNEGYENAVRKGALPQETAPERDAFESTSAAAKAAYLTIGLLAVAVVLGVLAGIGYLLPTEALQTLSLPDALIQARGGFDLRGVGALVAVSVGAIFMVVAYSSVAACIAGLIYVMAYRPLLHVGAFIANRVRT